MGTLSIVALCSNRSVMKYHQMNQMKIYEKIHIWLFDFNNVCNHFPSLLHNLQLALKSLKLYQCLLFYIFLWEGFGEGSHLLYFMIFLWFSVIVSSSIKTFIWKSETTKQTWSILNMKLWQTCRDYTSMPVLCRVLHVREISRSQESASPSPMWVWVSVSLTLIMCFVVCISS